MAEIISFYGTDGSGKSTIAKEFSSLNKNVDSVMLGGSSYKSWLNPEVARLTLGEKHTIGEKPQSVEEELRLYEDIAIACYGFARVLADRGSEVVIDSDPYFKRIIWGTLGLDEDAASRYIAHFEERMAEGLGGFEGPDIVVGINMGDSAKTSQEELLLRLTGRESNTAHDPKGIEELAVLDERVNVIWSEINLGVKGLSSVLGFNNRLGVSRVFTVENPSCNLEDVALQSNRIATSLRREV